MPAASASCVRTLRAPPVLAVAAVVFLVAPLAVVPGVLVELVAPAPVEALVLDLKMKQKRWV